MSAVESTREASSAEQANEIAERANERMEERMAKYRVITKQGFWLYFQNHLDCLLPREKNLYNGKQRRKVLGDS